MSLSTARLSSKLTPRTSYIFIRNISVSTPAEKAKIYPTPGPATIQMTVETLPGKPKGHIGYDRNDKVTNFGFHPDFGHHEWRKFLFGKEAHDMHFIYYGFWGMFGLWLIGLAYIAYTSFDKAEVWADRWSKNEFGERPGPLAWERSKDSYWKRHTSICDMTGISHNRLPILEAIQDEMLKASNERKRNRDTSQDLKYMRN